MLKNEHLTESDIAYCAEAVKNGTFESLDAYIRTHLEACDACAQEVLAVTAIIGSLEKGTFEFSLKDTPELPLVKSSKFSSYSTLTKVAAVAAILIFAVSSAVIIMMKTNTVEPQSPTYIAAKNTEKNVLDQDTIEEAPANNLLTVENNNTYIASYEPHEMLETLFNNSRGTYRSVDVKVKTPSEVQFVNTNVLSWSNPRHEKLYVEIFNNNGTMIESYTLNTEEMPLPPLEKGLYYWKLINEEYDLLFVGKIIN